MISQQTKSMIAQAKEIYERPMRSTLEQYHSGRFVAIEPDSGDYFVGESFDQAVKSARAKHPSKLSHVIRIGHGAALHLGEMPP